MTSRNIPSFAPRGDTEIGFVEGKKVKITPQFMRWLDAFRIRVQNSADPAGIVRMTLGSTEPEGWLLLNGQTVTERLYPRLAEIFGATDGIVTLPDYSNRIAMGAGSLVSLMGTAGASTAMLTVEQMPRHSHAVADKGHRHGALDRGHTHDINVESHTHENAVLPDHDHDFSVPDHTHGLPSSFSSASSGGGLSVMSTPGGAVTGAGGAHSGTTAAQAETDIVIPEAEISATAIKSRADIEVKRATSNISVEDNGDGESFSILNPVFGVNYLVKT